MLSSTSLRVVRRVAIVMAVLLTLLVLLALRPRVVFAQDPVPPPAAPACAANSVVHKVLLSVVSDDTVMTGQRVAVRVRYPVQVDLVATPEGTGAFWLLPLADPTSIDSLQLQPRVAGLRSTSLARPRAELRAGECIARAAFRLQRVWSVEVASKPESLRVEERLIGNATAPAEARFTRFSSREVGWSDRLSLRVFVKNESFDHEIAPARFKNPADPVTLSKHEIADKMCRQHNRCPNMFMRLLHGSLLDQAKVEELSFKLVLP